MDNLGDADESVTVITVNLDNLLTSAEVRIGRIQKMVAYGLNLSEMASPERIHMPQPLLDFVV